MVKPLPPRATRTSPKIKSKSPTSHNCKYCEAEFDNYRSLNNHMRIHYYPKQGDRKAVKKDGKDVKCTDCRRSFPSKGLLNIHRCPKQGGECIECGRHFYTQKSLIRHKSSCVQRKREVFIHPSVRRVLKPLQVRVARCDPLLKNVSGEHYDVSGVELDFGIDRRCLYPYISLGMRRIKFEPGYMVNINDEIKEAFDADKYVHWDSEDTDSDVDVEEITKNVDSLTALSLKTLFSNKLIGKVPKKRRKVKAEKAFDYILNVSEFDPDLSRGIDNIIDSLDDEKIDSKINDKSGDNDSLFGDEKAPASNNDFDSLFSDKSVINDNDKVDGNDVSAISDKVCSKEDINNECPVKDDGNTNINKTVSSREIDESLNKDNEETNVNSEYIVLESTGIKSSGICENIVNKNENCGEVADGDENIHLEKDIIDDEKTEISINKSDETQSKDDTNVSDRINEGARIEDEQCEAIDTSDRVTDKDNVKDNEENLSTCETKHIDAKSDVKSDKAHVNGKSELEEKFAMDDLDLSGSEIDDNRLMEALDAQIGENDKDAKNDDSDKMDKEKISLDDLVPCPVKTDLESISDDDFNLNE